MRSIANRIFFRWMKWKFNRNFPVVKKCVIAVVPHTSWHDFYVGVLCRKIIGLDMHFVGKASLFRPPFGWYFRWMGGHPVDRSKSNNFVEAVAQIFDEQEEFRLALAPEGTRKKVEKLKTGFYYIAKTASVPIVLVAFDHARKEVKFSAPIHPTDDMEYDFLAIHSFFRGVKGRVPEYSFDPA